MHKWLLALSLAITLTCGAQVDRIDLSTAKFHKGHEDNWILPSFNDNDWKTIRCNEPWESQGYEDYNGYACYRFHFMLGSAMKNASFFKDSIRIYLARIDDADEIYLNGILISKNGNFPEDKGGYITVWNKIREIHLPANSSYLIWDQPNLISVKVYDGGGAGGIFSASPYINMMDLVDAVSMDIEFGKTADDSTTIHIKNSARQSVYGMIKGEINSFEDGKIKTLDLLDQPAGIEPGNSRSYKMKYFPDQRTEMHVYFIEENTKKKVEQRITNHYILTPKPSESPRINSAAVYGVRPGSPFLYKIAATGKKPLLYAAEGLPDGLSINKENGVISGRLQKAGNHKIVLSVKNELGETKKELTVKAGSLLALTPPMGWNSWNCWGLSVSDEKLRSSAQALIDKGLIDHGWTYMNIDDGWEDSARNGKGEIVTNAKFPDMKGLGDWLHERGLKFGIYSSPGTLTCGGYLGSYLHEEQDAKTYSNWGIDYLKYDWCSYETVYRKEKDTTVRAFIKPYAVMQKALRSQPRDIIYSLCQYGMRKVWQWGDKVDGNSWRTTGDIEDTWESLRSIGFSQNEPASWAKPGRWNDPDMLIVGQVGWGPRLHPTRLNADEQYTHISLWCLLSSPLLIGCDISKIDEFTLNLLTNDEIIAINQDPLGKQARQIKNGEKEQVWAKEMKDGSKAVGLFNLSEEYREISLPVKDLKLSGSFGLRDCWRQKDLGRFNEYKTWVPPHGVVVLSVK